MLLADCIAYTAIPPIILQFPPSKSDVKQFTLCRLNRPVAPERVLAKVERVDITVGVELLRKGRKVPAFHPITPELHAVYVLRPRRNCEL